jgi:hypothetical protein
MPRYKEDIPRYKEDIPYISIYRTALGSVFYNTSYVKSLLGAYLMDTTYSTNKN